MKLRTIYLLALGLAMLPGSSQGETFKAAETVLKDRAFLVKLAQGTRRVRMQIKDPASGQWELATMSHLSGNEGLFKVRVPDDVLVEQCLVEVSDTDPFPYEFYKGKTGFSQSEAIADTANRNLVNLAGGGGAAVPGAAPAANDAAEKAAPASPDKVQESDLWQWSGRRLYFFNQQRGLQVFDVADLAKPKRVATLRMPAVGDQMYLLEGDRALLITNQPQSSRAAQRLGWWDQKVELIVAKLDGASLNVESRIPLDGYFVESRMVGNRLYIATQFSRYLTLADGSQQWNQGMRINQIDFSNPAKPEVKKPLTLSDQNGWFWGAVVTATPDYFLLSTSRWYEKEQATRSQLHIIPISAGRELEVSAVIDTAAHLRDKFKLRVEDGILTTVSQAQTWIDNRKTYVETFDLKNSGKPAKLDSLTLAPRETVFATRFDGDRLYVVTFLLKDPLFVIDLKNPADLKILGELEIPGWSTYLVPQGDRLLSIGLEEGRVAVSLFNVADPKKLSMLTRVYPGAKWSWSEANWDEKAVGYMPDKNLLLLPISSYDEKGARNLMQIIDVLPDKLVQRGAVEHQVQGRRATAFDSHIVSISGQELITVDATDRDNPKLVSDITLAWPTDRVLAQGDYLLQIETGYEWDANKTAYLRVTPKNGVDTELAKLKLGQGTIIGTLADKNSLYIARRLNRTYKVELPPDPVVEGDVKEGQNVKPIERWETEYSLALDVIDLKDPKEPILLGTHVEKMTADAINTYQDVVGAFLPSGHLLWYPENGRSFYQPWRWWGGGIAIDAVAADAPAAKGIAVGDVALPCCGWWYPSTTSANLPVYDVADKTKPALISHTTVKFENAWETGQSRLNGSKLMLSYRSTSVREKDQAYEHEYRIREVDFSSPAKPIIGDPINVPGLVEGAHRTATGGVVLFTTAAKLVDKQDQGWSSSNGLLQASIYDGTKAFLVDEITLIDGRYTPIAVHDRFVLKGKVGDKDPGLAVYEWSPTVGKFAQGSDIPFEIQPYQIEVASNLLFQQDGNLIEVFALEDLPNKPRRTTVTLSGQIYGIYTNRIELDANRSTAWLAAGPYGVETLDLSLLKLGPLLKTAAQSLPEWVDRGSKALPLVRASAQDFVGALNKDQTWAFRSYSTALDYDSWAQAYFNPANDEGVRLPEFHRDNDGDGLSNGLEFLWSTDPTLAASRTATRETLMLGQDGKRYLRITGLPLGPEQVGMKLVPEVSSDLKTWIPAPAGHDVFDGTLALPIDKTWQFARVRVESEK